MKVYIDCFNLASAGGIVQLEIILNILNSHDVNFTIVTNKRKLVQQFGGVWVRTIVSRDFFLFNKTNVLYFSNIPPIYRPSKNRRSIFFLHQRYWVDRSGFALVQGILPNIKIRLKYIYFNLFKLNIDHYIIQTEVMSRLLGDKVKEKIVLPLFQVHMDLTFSKKELCLIVGDDSMHKRIIDESGLLEWLKKNRIGYRWVGYSGKVNSDGTISSFVTHDKIKEFYKQARYVFISSYFESFGFPFIEAGCYKCVVITQQENEIAEELLSKIYLLRDLQNCDRKGIHLEEASLKLCSKDVDLIGYLNKVFI